jgi:hypothetical protein
MAVVNRYIDLNASGANDGTSPSDAWTSIDAGLSTTSLSTSDDNYIWIRRQNDTGRTIETFTSDMAVAEDGTAEFPIKVIAWPRASEAATEGTWTNGSKSVSAVVGVSLDKGKHTARYITAPDGNQYMIAKVTGTTSFELIAPYPGATVSTTSGAFTIQADEYYDTRPAAGTSAGWDADDPWMPLLDGNAANYCIAISQDDSWHFEGLHIIDFMDSLYGMIQAQTSYQTKFIGCFVEIQDATALADPMFYCQGNYLYLRKCSVQGHTSYVSGAYGFRTGNGGVVYLVDCRIETADRCFHLYGDHRIYMDNVYLTHHHATTGYYFYQDQNGHLSCWGRDVTFGAGAPDYMYNSSAQLYLAGRGINRGLFIENYGHELGIHYRMTNSGILQTKLVDGASDPVKRTGGADIVYQVNVDNLAVGSRGTKLPGDIATSAPIDEITFELDAATYDQIRFYCQSQDNIAADYFFMEVSYIDAYDETNNIFHKVRVLSDEAISARSGASDWSQYLEVPDITLPVKSNVTVKFTLRKNLPTGDLFIDPLPYITVTA